MDTKQKILGFSEIEPLISGFRAKGARTVVAVGWFDILCAEYCRLLAKIKPQGDVLLAVVQADDERSRATVLRQSARAQLAAALQVVDCVVICDKEQLTRLLNLSEPVVVEDLEASVGRNVVNDVLSRYAAS